MTRFRAALTGPARVRTIRTAALGAGLAISLAASPLVFADSPPAATPASPLIPQQSFAPLVRRVLPAVVNISVTEKSSGTVSDQLPEGFRDSPFGDFMK